MIEFLLPLFAWSALRPFPAFRVPSVEEERERAEWSRKTGQAYAALSPKGRAAFWRLVNLR